MNILQLITRRQYRGAEVFAGRLGRELISMGHEVVLAGLYAPPERALRLPRATEADLSQKQPGLLPSIKIMKTLAMCMDDFDIQLVQANAGDTLKYAVLSRRLYGWDAPIIYRNASVMSRWTGGWLRRRFNRWLLNQTEAIACVSRGSKRDMEEELNIRHVPTHYIPNGIQCEATRSRARFPLEIPDDALIFLHVGAFTEEKRHDLLLRYFERLATDAAFPVYLIMIGDGPLWSDIQRTVLDHPYSDQIRMTGTVEEPDPYYDRADILLLCSDVEGIPAAVLEAGAHAVPTVAFNVGGLEECVKDKETGMLVSPGDDESFLRAALWLIEDDPLRREYGKAAREWVCEQFDIKKVSQRFETLYRALIEEHS